MKKLVVIAMSTLCLSMTTTHNVYASKPFSKFTNCTELRKTFPKGVAKDKKSACQTGATVNKKVYQKNIGSDRDKDGIACELSK